MAVPMFLRAAVLVSAVAAVALGVLAVWMVAQAPWVAQAARQVTMAWASVAPVAAVAQVPMAEAAREVMGVEGGFLAREPAVEPEVVAPAVPVAGVCCGRVPQVILTKIPVRSWVARVVTEPRLRLVPAASLAAAREVVAVQAVRAVMVVLAS